MIERTATREPIRCAWCHGDLGGEVFSQCAGCKTVFHEDCGREGCPTMGCSVRALPLAAAPARPSFSDFFFAGAGAFLILETIRLFLFRREPVPDILLRGQGPVYVLMVFVQVIASIAKVTGWLRARWRIWRARRSSFTRRRGTAKI